MNNDNYYHNSIAAIVVTYNRLELLKECIQSLRQQSRKVDQIIVVNNSSTDGTAEWLETQSDLVILTVPNLGSSGGQAAGIRTAYERGYGWFWLMDDDTIPEPDALSELVSVAPYQQESTGFLASLVLTKSYQLQPLSWPLRDPVHWLRQVVETRVIPVEATTFVSVMVSRCAVEKVGLPVREFFLLWDDIEYTTRISRSFSGYFVVTSKVVHKTPEFGTSNFSTSPMKMYYHQRNRVMYLRCQPISNLKYWTKLFQYILSDLIAIITFRYKIIYLAATIRGIFTPITIETVSAYSPTKRM